MRNARWILPVLALFLFGCRHMESAGHDDKTQQASTRMSGRLRLSLPAAMLGLPEDEGAVHAAAGIALLGLFSVLHKTDPHVAFYMADMGFFLMLAIKWPDKRAENAATGAFLDEVVKAHEAGFIAEYVVSRWYNPNWKLPVRRSLRMRKFREWEENNLGSGSIPLHVRVVDEDGTVVSAQYRQIAVSADSLKGKALLDSILSREECRPHLAYFKGVVDRWPGEKRDGRRLVSGSLDDYLSYVADVATEGPVRPFPELISPEYYYAAFALERCSARDGGDNDKWLALLKRMNPTAGTLRQEKAQEIAKGYEVRSAACPGLDTEIDEESCAGAVTDEFGYSREAPMELGFAAGGQALWFGRLVCANGATARTRRLGSVGAPPVESSSSLSPLGGGGIEVLDKWEVRCPGEDEPRVLYASVYRCGLNCPPKPFRVMSARAAKANGESHRVIRGEDDPQYAEAIAIIETIPEGERDVEVIQSWLGVLYLGVGELGKARTHFERVVSMNPDNPYHRLHLSFVDAEEGKAEPYLATLDRLLEELPSDHELYPELVCRKGLLLRAQDKGDKADDLVRRGCELGDKRCCD